MAGDFVGAGVEDYVFRHDGGIVDGDGKGTLPGVRRGGGLRRRRAAGGPGVGGDRPVGGWRWSQCRGRHRLRGGRQLIGRAADGGHGDGGGHAAADKGYASSESAAVERTLPIVVIKLFNQVAFEYVRFSHGYLRFSTCLRAGPSMVDIVPEQAGAESEARG